MCAVKPGVAVNIVYHVNAIIIICGIKYVVFRSSVVSKHYSFSLLEVCFDVFITASLRAGI